METEDAHCLLFGAGAFTSIIIIFFCCKICLQLVGSDFLTSGFARLPFWICQEIWDLPGGAYDVSISENPQFQSRDPQPNCSLSCKGFMSICCEVMKCNCGTVLVEGG